MAKVTRNEVLVLVQEVRACHAVSHGGVQIRYLCCDGLCQQLERVHQATRHWPRDNDNHARQNKGPTFAPAPPTG
jgi:hypothetical protein